MLFMNHIPWCASVYHASGNCRIDRQKINKSLKKQYHWNNLEKCEGTQFIMAGLPTENLIPSCEGWTREG